MWPAEWIAAASAALSPAASLSGNAARWRRRRAEQHSCRRPLLRARWTRFACTWPAGRPPN